MPRRQGVADLALVRASVVSAGDTGAMAAVVVEHGLDNVWLHAEVGQAGGDAAADVMNSPRGFGDARAFIERDLALHPTREAVGPRAEKLIAAHHLWHALDDVERGRHQRQDVLPVVLPSGEVDIDLRQCHVADLGAPGAEENQQLDVLAIFIVAGSVPDGRKLAVAQHALARLALLRLGRGDCRVALAQSHLHRPSKEIRQRPFRARGCGVAAFAHNSQDARGDVAARDRVDRHAVQGLEI